MKKDFDNSHFTRIDKVKPSASFKIEKIKPSLRPYVEFLQEN